VTAEAAAKKTTGSLYHVLKQKVGDGETYEPFAANVTARSATEAIRQVTTEAGTYVAIPAKSFRPVKVTVHTETTIRLG